MANRITTLVVDSTEPARLADFWCQVLGYERVEDAEGEEAWVEIGPPGQPEEGPVPTLLFQRVPDPTPGKRRLHLDLNATDRDQDDELDRLLALGATRADVGQTGEESWHVLADPEGNEFCLLRRRLDPPAPTSRRTP
jgi:catechol 2,3-dioxygenase-like lactoylglutathione lyase family enzyme